MKLSGNIKKRLAGVQQELARERDALRILDEQIAFQEGVADDAETRAVVSATPLADREHREAAGDLARLRRQQDENRARIAELLAEQDHLLDRLLVEGGAP